MATFTEHLNISHRAERLNTSYQHLFLPGERIGPYFSIDQHTTVETIINLDPKYRFVSIQDGARAEVVSKIPKTVTEVGLTSGSPVAAVKEIPHHIGIVALSTASAQIAEVLPDYLDRIFISKVVTVDAIKALKVKRVVLGGKVKKKHFKSLPNSVTSVGVCCIENPKLAKWIPKSVKQVIIAQGVDVRFARNLPTHIKHILMAEAKDVSKTAFPPSVKMIDLLLCGSDLNQVLNVLRKSTLETQGEEAWAALTKKVRIDGKLLVHWLSSNRAVNCMFNAKFGEGSHVFSTGKRSSDEEESHGKEVRCINQTTDRLSSVSLDEVTLLSSEKEDTGEKHDEEWVGRARQP